VEKTLLVFNRGKSKAGNAGKKWAQRIGVSRVLTDQYGYQRDTEQYAYVGRL